MLSETSQAQKKKTQEDKNDLFLSSIIYNTDNS